MNITREGQSGLPASKIRTHDTRLRSKCTKSGAFLSQDRQWLLWRRHSCMDREFICADSEYVMLLNRINYYYYYYYYYYYWIEPQMGPLPDGSGTTIRHNTKIHVSHKITPHAHTKHSTRSRSHYIQWIHHTKKSETIPTTRPPLWSSGQSFWLQIKSSRFDSRRYQIFWEVVGLERGPLSLVSTIEELLGRKRSGSGLESR
jgi:hypothetical protein